MAKSKAPSKKAYTCGVNWQHDLDPDNADHIEFYGSVKALKKHRQCWKECGIVEVQISLKKWVAPQDLFKNIKIKGKKNAKVS